MNKLDQLLIKTLQLLSKGRRVVLALSVVVVFITTYLLILPAFTLEKDEAAKQGGIDIPGVESVSQESVDDGDVSSAEDSSQVDKTSETPSTEANEDQTDDKGQETTDKVTSKKKASKTDTTSQDDIEQDVTETDPLTYEDEFYRITVEDKANVLPENTEIKVEEIIEEEDEESYKEYCDDSVQAINDDENTPPVKSLKFARFYDIKLIADGEEIKVPEDAVSVRIEYDDELAESMNVDNPESLRIVHFAENQETGEIEPEVLDSKTVEVNTDKKDNLTDTTFEAESFSVYGVIYTVDFHWEVDGKKFDFSIPGGGFISLQDLIEAIGISNTDKETKAFVSTVDNVEFSSPELMSVSKVEEETTVGSIKDDLDLECEYSDELTEEQIDEINAQKVDAGDWALISLKAFNTEETLTITMKNGDRFVIKVTDAQDPLDLDGKAYAIVNTKNGTSTAMKAEISNNRLQGQTVTLGQNGGIPTCSDNADVWVFEYVEDNKYYIHSGDLYLKITGTNNSNWQIELVDRDNADPITIVENNGTYRFLNDNNISINNYGGNFWAGNWNNSDEYMSFRTPYDPSKPATRPTEDTRAVGLTINLFDYGPDSGSTNLDHVNNVLGGDNVSTYWDEGINQYSDLKFFSYGTGYTDTCGINNFTGSTPNHKAAQGIVQENLSNGYPSLQNGQSLDYLFDMSSREGKTIYQNVNHLFWMENGNYKYDSDESYAYYNKGTKDFKVYNTTFEEEGSTDTDTFKVGFFPFNDYDDRYHCIHGDNFAWNCTGSQNTHGVNDEVGHYNHHFGLSMTGTFEIVSNKNMNFHFSGDDDMWVFVDDVLVLDIGGIHNPIDGDIDFRTGDVTVSPNSVAVEGGELAPNTIAAAFERAGKTWDGSEGTYHEIKVFYIERGGMYSNLEMEINLPLVPSGNLTFDKKDDQSAGVAGAQFQLFTDPACEHPLSFKSENAVAVSDENGVVTFSGIPVGNYYMKEIQAPVGYILDPTVYEVTIKDKNYPEQGSSFIKKPNGEIVTEILNGKKQIVVTLEKEWAGGTPAGATATFALKRLRSYEGDSIPAPSTINVYRVGGEAHGNPSLNTWDFSKLKLEKTEIYAGNSTTTLSWNYHGYYGSEWNRTDYFIGDTLKHDGPSNVQINLPAGETVNVYICDGNVGTQYEQYGVNNISINGVDPSTVSPTHVDVDDEEDSDFNSNPPTHVFPVGTTNWTYIFPPQEAESLRSDGLIETYKYYIEEVSHSPSDWIVSISDNALTESGTITAINYKNEVYVEKRWYDPDGNLLDPQPTDEVSVTLASTNGGQITGDVTKDISAQNKGTWQVEDSTEKVYEATEETLSGFDTTYSFKDIGDTSERITGGVHRGGTIYVNNTKKLGSLQITKNVLYNGREAGTDTEKAKLNGDYKFKVKAEDGDEITGSPFTITVSNGVSNSILIEDLEEGDYTIEEIDSGDLELYQASGGKSVTNNIVTATVTAGNITEAQLENDAKAKFINNYVEYEVIIIKVDTANFDIKLGGAVFDLYDEDAVEAGQIKDGAQPLKTGLVSSSDDADKGKLSLGMLRPGTYYLKETQAPAGYNTLESLITITVANNGVSLLQDTRQQSAEIVQDTATLNVTNTSGVELPQAGGPGTTLFYILGSLLVIAGGIYFVARRRLMNH